MLNPILNSAAVSRATWPEDLSLHRLAGVEVLKCPAFLRHRPGHPFNFELEIAPGIVGVIDTRDPNFTNQLEIIEKSLRADQGIVSTVYVYPNSLPTEASQSVMLINEVGEQKQALYDWQSRTVTALDMFQRQLNRLSTAEEAETSYGYKLVGVFGSSAWGRPRPYSFARKLDVSALGLPRVLSPVRFPSQYAQTYDEAHHVHCIAWSDKQEVNETPYRLMLPPSDVDVVVAMTQKHGRWWRIIEGGDDVPGDVQRIAEQVFDETGILIHLHYWKDTPLRSVGSVIERFVRWEQHQGLLQLEEAMCGEIKRYLPCTESILCEKERPRTGIR